MRTHWNPSFLAPMSRLLVCLVLLLSVSPAVMADETASQGGGDALLEAAQQQDMAKVQELLKAGVDVDSKSRYGATALFFAADKGHVEMVKLLLEKGASVDVTDTFYEATPLGWALFKMEESKPHREIVLMLLEQKPEDSKNALSFAARQGDLEVAKAALATDKVPAEDIRTAVVAAKEHEELAAFLQEQAPAEEAAEIEIQQLTPEQLQRYVGQFKNEERDLIATLAVNGEDLTAVLGSPEPQALDCIGEDTFMLRDDPAVRLSFGGRGGMVEGMTFQRGEFSLNFRRYVAEEASTAEAEEPEVAPLPKGERQAARPWPAFRGDNAAGNGDGQGVPFTWDGEKGEHVRWKTPIPGIGLSSPVIWGSRIFLTTAISGADDDTFRTGLYGDVDSVDDSSEHVWKTYALDLHSGEILWEHEASRREPKVARHLKSSHANPTPVTDGKYVVAHFSSEGIFCYTVDGELKWKKDLGTLSSGWFYDASYEWGFAASPILYDGTVILQTDIQKGSYISALDLETGEELWRTARDEIPTWGTPSVLPGKGGPDEIITNGTTVRGYHAKTGEELWTLSPNSEVTVGTPVVAEGMAFVTGGYPPARPIYAIKPGGRGDLSLEGEATSSDHIAWSVNPGGTYIPSPIAYDGILYMLNNNGRLAAYDIQTGERLYRQRVSGSTSFSASPVAADGRLLLTTEEGDTFVVRAGKVYEELGKNELGEVVMTTPAMSDGVLVIRGIDHVFGIGAPAATEGGDGEVASAED